MATGLFSSRSKTLHDDAQAVEEQIAELREEIAALARTLAGDASRCAGNIRRKARAAKAEARGPMTSSPARTRRRITASTPSRRSTPRCRSGTLSATGANIQCC